MGSAGGERADPRRFLYGWDVMVWPGLLFPLILAEPLDGGYLSVDWDRWHRVGTHRRIRLLAVRREPGALMGVARLHHLLGAGKWIQRGRLVARQRADPAGGAGGWLWDATRCGDRRLGC